MDDVKVQRPETRFLKYVERWRKLEEELERLIKLTEEAAEISRKL